MAGSNKKSACTEKWKAVKQNEKSPKKHQKGPIVVNGKTTPKGKSPKEANQESYNSKSNKEKRSSMKFSGG